MAVARFLAAPVDSYQAFLDASYRSVRANAPFTFMAYGSLIPDRKDDWTEIAGKVVDFITFRFLIDFALTPWSLYWSYLPFLPFVLDVAWQFYHFFQPPAATEEGRESVERPLLHRVRALGLVHFL